MPEECQQARRHLYCLVDHLAVRASSVGKQLVRAGQGVRRGQSVFERKPAPDLIWGGWFA
jgi:hypothetical protein